MTDERDKVALRSVRLWLDLAALGGWTDAQLLDRFRAGGGEAAEVAFAALVARHGPMVLRACHAVLRNGHDVEDAFQATFLVLVRRCGGLWVGESLGPWLHRVASRVAVRAQVAATRRRRHEQQAAAVRVESGERRDPHDFGPILHAEIDRLPERYRGPIVLCDLEGFTNEEAAAQLGCPVGTIKSRLARARERLRLRLTRRGVLPAAGGVGTLLAEQSASAVSSRLALATASAASRFAVSGRSAAGAVPAAFTLVEGVVGAMSLNKLAIRCAALLLGVFVATGVLVLAADRPAATSEPKMQSPPVAPSSTAAALGPPEQPVPKEPLRRLEEKLAKAKSLHLEFEAVFEGEGSTGKFKGTLDCQPGGKARMEMKGEAEEKPFTMLMISDGKRTSVAGGGPAQEPGETPKKLDEFFRATLARTGMVLPIYAAEAAPGGEQPKELDTDELFKVSNVKTGKKDKVDGKEAQMVEYELTVKGAKEPLSATVWLDAKTELPLKRVLKGKPDGKTITITETYTDVALDKKIEAKTFELPK